MPERPLVLGRGGIGVDDVHSVAERRRTVRIDPAALDAMQRTSDALLRAVDTGTPVYGVTTGLGARSVHQLCADELAGMSLRTVRGRATGVGDPLPERVVRAGLLCRAASMAVGGSGASAVIADLLVAMLNAGVHPVVPSIGALGTGDLAPMAHVGLAIVGEGRACLNGVEADGAATLAAAGLEPITLGPRDGLALVGSNAVSIGHAALVDRRIERLARWAHGVVALTFEGFRASTAPMSPAAIAARPAPGEAESAALINALLDGGQLTDPRNARRLQDPISLRAVACTHGALLTALAGLNTALDAELRGNGDNPLVLDDATVLPTAGFHTPALALAVDTVALATAQAAAAATARCARLLSPTMTGLPANLTTHSLGRSGFAPVLKTAEALTAEIMHHAHPTVLDPRPGASEVEDDSSNLPLGVRRLDRIAALLPRLLAIEALMAAQAIEFAAPPSIGVGARRLYDAVRAQVPPLDDDRPLGPEIEQVATAVFTDDDLLVAVIATPAAPAPTRPPASRR